jgi:hypothetical protein
VHPRRQQQADAEDGGGGEHHRAWSDSVGHPAREQAEAEVERGGDREHQRGGALAGAEVLGHRVEEGAEAVDDPVDGEHRQERGGHDDPPARRVQLMVLGVDHPLGERHPRSMPDARTRPERRAPSERRQANHRRAVRAEPART